MSCRSLARAALLLCICWTAPVSPSPAGPVAHAEDASEASAPIWVAFAAGAFFPIGEDGAGATGYAVIDEPAGPPFWTSYVRLGGADLLGLPLSRPFALPDARAYQLFERAMLRWTPGDPSAEIADILDLLWAAGREPWLSERGVPSMRAAEAVPLTRIGWLTDDAIRDAYFTAVHPDAESGLAAALATYGLPASLTEERDGQIVQRFDKALLTRDLTSGVINALPVGTLLRDSGLLTPGVLAPDRAIGGQLVTRAPRAVLSWPSVRGWGISEPVTSPVTTRPPSAASEPPASAVLAPTLAPSTPAGPTPTAASVPIAPLAPSPTARTGANRPAPTPTPQPTAPQPGALLLVKAVVNQGRAEHVVIANEGPVAQELTGWSIRSGTGGQQIAFPAGFVLAPGAVVRVHSGTGASALHRPPTDLFGTGMNVWNNAGDQALLVDPTGRVVSQLSYAG